MAESPVPVNAKLRAGDVWGEIKKHKGWYFIAFLLWGVPPVIATIWPTLTDKKVPDWLAENGWPRLKTLVVGWVAVSIVIALVIVVRSWLSAKRRAAELSPAKRDYLIAQLRDFVNEAREIERLPMLRQMGDGLTYRGTVEHFLSLYSPEWVARFREKKQFALQEMIAELLDGVPIPVPTAPDHSQQFSVDRTGPARIPESISRPPRQLSEEQLRFLTHCLTAVRGSITIQVYKEDSEALDLGRQLRQVLQNSGWRVDWRAVLLPLPEIGIVIKLRAVEGLSPENSALVRALKEIDLSPTLVRNENLTETILVIGANIKIDA
jgi:hypothetical protein